MLAPTRLRDTWTAANGSAWPTSLWDADDASSGSSSDIQSGQGRLLTGTTGSYSDSMSKPLTSPLPINFELTVDLIITDVTECYPRIHFRDRDGFRADSWLLQALVAFNAAELVRQAGYTPTVTHNVGYTINLNDVIHVRLRCDGPDIRVRLWSNATTEPGTWTFAVQDWTFYSPIQCRLELALQGGPAASSRSCRWDNLDIRAIGQARRR